MATCTTKQMPRVDPKFQKYVIVEGEGKSQSVLFTVNKILSSFRLIKIANFFFDNLQNYLLISILRNV